MSDEYQNSPYNRFSTPDKLTTLTKERNILAAKVRELEEQLASQSELYRIACAEIVQHRKGQFDCTNPAAKEAAIAAHDIARAERGITDGRWN